MRFTIKTAAGEEPLTVQEAKDFLRVEGTADDNVLDTLITAARLHAENILSRSLVTKTYEARADYMHDGFILPRPNLISVTSIKYNDTDGVQQTLAADQYVADIYSAPARIVPAYGVYWPRARLEPNSVIIEYIAGYGSAEDVPQNIKQAMLLHIGHMFENREATVEATVSEVPMGYKALMANYIVRKFE